MKSQVALPFWLHEIDPEEYLFTLWRTVKDGNTTPGRIREFPRLCTVDMCRFRYIINVNNAPYYGQLWFISVQTCDQCQTVVNVTHWSSKQPSVPVFPHHQVWLERLIINGCEKRSEKLNGPQGSLPGHRDSTVSAVASVAAVLTISRQTSQLAVAAEKVGKSHVEWNGRLRALIGCEQNHKSPFFRDTRILSDHSHVSERSWWVATAAWQTSLPIIPLAHKQS